MRVVLRADATASGGVGHVMRAIALVEVLHARGDEAVLVGDVAVSLAARACRAAQVEVVASGSAHGFDDAGAEALADLARNLGADLLHVDHYGVTDGMLAACRARGLPMSTMADGSFGLRPADLVVDPTLGATGDGVARLGGVAYAPVRRRVLAARSLDEHPGRADRAGVLVVMGGTDAAAVTPVVVGLLAQLPGVGRVRVVAAGGARAAIRAAGKGLDIVVSGPVADLARLATRHAFTVSAAGTTTIELACVGAPMAIVPVVANQRRGYEQLVDAGAAIGLGTAEDLAGGRALGALRRLLDDEALREEMSLHGRELVDGRGAERVVRTWRALTEQLTVRLARWADAPLLLGWRNDPATRSASRETGPVGDEEHRAWLTRTLAADDHRLLIVESGGAPVATVRFDRLEQGVWEISVTVAPTQRGHGLAARAVGAGQQWLGRRVAGIDRIVAVHREGNEASRSLFASLGYVPDDQPAERGFVRVVRRGPMSAESRGPRSS